MKLEKDSYLELVAPQAAFKTDLESIEADCLSNNFDDAALRFKKIATNLKSTIPYNDDGSDEMCQDEIEARNWFILIAKTIDEHLQEVLEDWRYASFRLALVRTKTARFVLNDLTVN